MMRFKFDYDVHTHIHIHPLTNLSKRGLTSQLKHPNAISLTICHVRCVTIVYMDQSCNCDEKYPLILCAIFYGIPIINLFMDMANNLWCLFDCRRGKLMKKLPSRATLVKGKESNNTTLRNILWRMVNSLVDSPVLEEASVSLTIAQTIKPNKILLIFSSRIFFSVVQKQGEKPSDIHDIIT